VLLAALQIEAETLVAFSVLFGAIVAAVTAAYRGLIEEQRKRIDTLEREVDRLTRVCIRHGVSPIDPPPRPDYRLRDMPMPPDPGPPS
jgi:hypothetical protein